MIKRLLLLPLILLVAACAGGALHSSSGYALLKAAFPEPNWIHSTKTDANSQDDVFLCNPRSCKGFNMVFVGVGKEENTGQSAEEFIKNSSTANILKKMNKVFGDELKEFKLTNVSKLSGARAGVVIRGIIKVEGDIIYIVGEMQAKGNLVAYAFSGSDNMGMAQVNFNRVPPLRSLF